MVVSRQLLIDSKFSTVICAPIYSSHHGLSTQVQVSVEEGPKHTSTIHCDELISIPKDKLTDFIGLLSSEKLELLDQALKRALDLL